MLRMMTICFTSIVILASIPVTMLGMERKESVEVPLAHGTHADDERGKCLRIRTDVTVSRRCCDVGILSGALVESFNGFAALSRSRNFYAGTIAGNHAETREKITENITHWAAELVSDMKHGRYLSKTGLMWHRLGFRMRSEQYMMFTIACCVSMDDGLSDVDHVIVHIEWVSVEVERPHFDLNAVPGTADSVGALFS